MSAKFKRTRLWVDPPVQSRLLGRLAVYMLVYTATLLHVGFAIEVGEKIVLGGAETKVSSLYLDYLLRQKSLLIGAVVILPVLLLDLLRFSHRIVGPLFRCRKMMQQMAGGNAVNEFVPRKHDLMPELFEA